ncbi:MAG: glycosyl transferase family 2, partial [Planctomycetaceae bacterium]|nr:glycosyl transferase family 2 [Planctomycetaceae bacterium]
AHMLPYFFRHYDGIVNEYVIYDHNSDDGTQEILAAHPRVTTGIFEVEGESVCECGRTWKSNIWKASRGKADLVLVCDVDELLWHPHLADYLATSVAAGETLFRPTGWDMVSNTFPVTNGQIYEEVRHGARNADFDKLCLFNPDAVEEINYRPGCHIANPTGNIVCNPNHELKLLHFKYLGADYVITRYAALGVKLKSIDKANGYGKQYSLTPEEIKDRMSRLSLQPLFD